MRTSYHPIYRGETKWGTRRVDYDDYGRVVLILVTTDKGEDYTRHTFEYDDQGNLVNEERLEVVHEGWPKQNYKFWEVVALSLLTAALAVSLR